MDSEVINLLYEKVDIFKSWAKQNYPEKTEDDDNGEWEIGGPLDDMVDAVLMVFKNIKCDNATEKLISDILYVIARDNECEIVISELLRYEEWFLLLCRECLDYEYTNAKWQFAKYLADYSKLEGDSKELIFRFVESDDEYTSRMALNTLGKLYPDKAEEYAVRFWERNKYEEGSYEQEYQKIMVLWVLKDINSPKLNHYLELAEKSPYKYLRENADEIRGIINL